RLLESSRHNVTAGTEQSAHTRIVDGHIDHREHRDHDKCEQLDPLTPRDHAPLSNRSPTTRPVEPASPVPEPLPVFSVDSPLSVVSTFGSGNSEGSPDLRSRSLSVSGSSSPTPRSYPWKFSISESSRRSTFTSTFA